MNYLKWGVILFILFMISYTPRTGKLGKFFVAPITDASRAPQSNSDTNEYSE